MSTPQDWNNVDLDSYEADANLIDPLTFAGLCLEIECNERDITPEVVEAHFYKRLVGIAGEAREIFAANRENITQHCRKVRKDKQGD